MKIKLKITALILMVIFCVKPNLANTANAASATKTISVPAKLPTSFGIYSKSSTSHYVYATNYSGYGEYAYCYGSCASNLSGQWVKYTANYRLYKNNSETSLWLTNTIDMGKKVQLLLYGADTQQGSDRNCIKFTY